MLLVDQINVVLKEGQSYRMTHANAEIGLISAEPVELGFNGFEDCLIEQIPSGFIIHGRNHQVHGAIQEIFGKNVRLDLKEYLI